MRLRRLQRADAAAYRDIRLRSLREAPDAYGSTLDDWDVAPVSVFADRTETSVVLGAFDNAALVGLSVLDREKGGNTRHRGLITAVFVCAEARGRGVTVAMLGELAAIARGEALLQLELNVLTSNATAIRAYEAAGFRRVGTHPRAILSRGVFLDEYLMIRDLDGGGR